jgi:hypothetical protein
VEVVLAIGLVLAGLLIIDRLFAAEQRRRGRKEPGCSEALSAAIMDLTDSSIRVGATKSTRNGTRR